MPDIDWPSFLAGAVVILWIAAICILGLIRSHRRHMDELMREAGAHERVLQARIQILRGG